MAWRRRFGATSPQRAAGACLRSRLPHSFAAVRSLWSSVAFFFGRRMHHCFPTLSVGHRISPVARDHSLSDSVSCFARAVVMVLGLSNLPRRGCLCRAEPHGDSACKTRPTLGLFRPIEKSRCSATVPSLSKPVSRAAVWISMVSIARSDDSESSVCQRGHPGPLPDRSWSDEQLLADLNCIPFASAEVRRRLLCGRVVGSQPANSAGQGQFGKGAHRTRRVSPRRAADGLRSSSAPSVARHVALVSDPASNNETLPRIGPSTMCTMRGAPRRALSECGDCWGSPHSSSSPRPGFTRIGAPPLL